MDITLIMNEGDITLELKISIPSLYVEISLSSDSEKKVASLNCSEQTTEGLSQTTVSSLVVPVLLTLCTLALACNPEYMYKNPKAIILPLSYNYAVDKVSVLMK